jgi:hypothetical protein
MTGIRNFTTIEELSQWIEDQTNAANAALFPEQQALEWGDPWVRFLFTLEGDALIIFGRAYTLEEFHDIEIAHGATEDEWTQYTQPTLEASYADGYLYGRCFSTVEPTGELGNTHRVNVWPISQTLYDYAHEKGWDPATFETDELAELNVAYNNYREFAIITEGDWSP